jgi:hypothetical protein
MNSPLSKIALVVLVIALFAGTAYPQPGSIMLFVDPAYTDCDTDDIPGLLSIYVVHMHCVFPQYASGSQFMVDHWSFGCILTHVGETVHTPVSIGTTQTGLSLGYGGCIPCPNLLVTINFFAQGLSPDCCHIQVMPDVAADPPEVLVVGCEPLFDLAVATGGDVVINPTEDCFCDVAVQETNWGKIKSLYSE